MAGTLITLMEKIKSVQATIDPIKRFVFDDLSQINNDSQNEYPLLLVKPPQSTFDSIMEYQIYDVEMYVFDVELSNDVDHWTKKWDACQDHLRRVVQGILADRPSYVLVDNTVSIQLAHMQHNDKLIGAKASFKLRVYYGC